MKIIFVSSNHAPGPSGADISAHKLLVGLHRRGWEVRVVTDEGNRGLIDDRWRSGINFSYTSKDALIGTLRRVQSEFGADAIFTQSKWAIEAIRLGNQLKVPTFLFVRSIRPARLLAFDGACRPSRFVANSPATADVIRRAVGEESLILYPPIDPKDCVSTRPNHVAEHITMINPVKEKGGHLFGEVAKLLPDRKFHAVKGWKTLLGGVPPKHVPIILPNVDVSGPFNDMKPVYASTRILLVPSLWEEAFGRVAVEAMMNGIPVIASDRGALPWVVGNGGSVLASRDPRVWADEIEKYDCRKYYVAASRRAQSRAAAFDIDEQIERFMLDFSSALEGVHARRAWHVTET